MPLIEGQVLEGKYEIVRLLARGGMGDVYLGTHRRIGKPVAIKVLGGDLAGDASAVERFEREAKVATRIRSAHITETYDLGDLESGERFIVMELLEGETLGERLDREQRVAERSLAAIALQILDALASAHDAGVVHRDLKPDNVFLTKKDGRDFVKVVDFGVSKVQELETDPTRGRPLTVAGALIGTPAYMSPEQARGKAVDHRTDLYALGVVLYEATTGEPPFEADNLNDMLFRIALDTPAPLDVRVPSVTPELGALVQKAMAKAPDDRYRTAAEMREDVLAWQEALGPAPGARTSSSSITVPPRIMDSSMPTPRPWSIPNDDETEAELPRRRSKGWLVAMAIFAGLVVLGVTRPQEMRAMSTGLATRAAVLRGNDANANVVAPAAASTTTVTTTELPPPRIEASVAAPSPARPAATVTATPVVARAAPPKPTPPKATASAPASAEPPPAPPPAVVEPSPPKPAQARAEDTIY